MTAKEEPAELSAWKPVDPPPPGYLQVIRRSFDTGLHVLVLVRQRAEEYVVLSAIDHGTAKPSVRKEGISYSVPGTIGILCEACARWNGIADMECLVKPPAEREYFYADEAGKLSGPVGRVELFNLIRAGVITWESQAWENVRSLTGRGEWQPVLLALGFPAEDTVDALM